MPSGNTPLPELKLPSSWSPYGVSSPQWVKCLFHNSMLCLEHAFVINVSRGSSADYNNWSLNFSVCCPLWICVFLQVTSNFASLCPVLNNISFSDAQETYSPLHLGSVNSGLFFTMTLLYERVFHITRPLWGESIDQKVSSAETISMAWRFENSEVVSTKLTHVTMLLSHVSQ